MSLLKVLIGFLILCCDLLPDLDTPFIKTFEEIYIIFDC